MKIKSKTSAVSPGGGWGVALNGVSQEVAQLPDFYTRGERFFGGTQSGRQKWEEITPVSSLWNVAETQGQATEKGSKAAVLYEGKMSPNIINVGRALKESSHSWTQKTVKTHLPLLARVLYQQGCIVRAVGQQLARERWIELAWSPCRALRKCGAHAGTEPLSKGSCTSWGNTAEANVKPCPFLSTHTRTHMHTRPRRARTHMRVHTGVHTRIPGVCKSPLNLWESQGGEGITQQPYSKQFRICLPLDDLGLSRLLPPARSSGLSAAHVSLLPSTPLSLLSLALCSIIQ